MMPYNQCPWEDSSQLSEQGKQRGFLLQGAGVGGTAFGIQSAFVADAYGVPVVPLAMRSDFFRRTAPVDFTVARHVEVIADVAEATAADVLAAAILKAQAHALRRGRAVNDE